MAKNNKLKKKIKDLLEQTEKDKKFLLDLKLKLAKDLNEIDMKLVKNNGAILVLQKLLEDK